MSLDLLNSQIQSNRDAANTAHQNADRRIQATQNDTRLTPQAKLEDVARIRADLRQQLADLLAKEDTLVSDKLHALERTVLGTVTSDPAEVISFRDATERAAGINDPQTAEGTMRRALISGDTVLAKALLNRAVEMGWQTVADAYEAENPTVATALEDLMRLRRYKDNPGTMVGRWVYTAA